MTRVTNWKTTSLGDVVEILNRKRIPLSKIERETRQGPYRYFGAQGVIDHVDGFLFDGEFLLVAEDGENLRSRKQPVASLVAGRFWVNNHAHVLRAREGAANNRFLLHAINQAALGGLITGAAQPKLTKANLERIEFGCPSLAAQDRVAALLGAFDELIAINERRIELLEGLARSLYREWFVRFRYPGAGAPSRTPVSIPSGWERVPLNKLVSTQYGFTASAVRDAVGPKFLRGMDINKRSYIDWSEVPYCTVPADRVDGFRLETGDVCVIRMADPGKVGIVEQSVDAVFASYLVRLRSIEPRVPPYLLFHHLDASAYQSWISGSSTGSTRKSASAAVLTERPVVVPPVDIARRFDEHVSVLRGELTTLVAANASLARTRDLLLPRLVTGRLDISDVDLGDLLPEPAAA